MRVVPGNAYGSLVSVADPLSVFPSYQTISTYSGGSDFIIGGSGTAPFSLTNSGTGATANWLSLPPANRIGILSLDTGTTTTGLVSVQGMNTMLQLGSGQVRWRADGTIPTASDGTQTFTVRGGLGDAFLTGTDGVDAVFFRYTHSVNSGQWVCVTRSNSVETVTNTAVSATPGATTYQTLEIEVNASGSSADFRINGVTVATHTTNIPVGGSGRELGCGMSILKSAGTTSRSLYIDNQWIRFERSAAI